MPNNIRGLIVSGRICSGKNSFVSIFKDLVENGIVQNIAFADKLKLLAKYLLVRLSQNKIVYEVVYDISTIIYEQLFNKKIELPKIVQKMDPFARSECVQQYVKPNIRMPDFEDEPWDGESFPKKDSGLDDIDGLLWSDCGKPRKMLQLLGTEVMRDIKDSVWIDYVFGVVRKNPYKFFVISDGRFPNEIDVSKKEKFLDVRVEASEAVRVERGLDRDNQDYSNMLYHASEIALDEYPFSVVINNDGALCQLKKQILDHPALGDLIGTIRSRRHVAERDFPS